MLVVAYHYTSVMPSGMFGYSEIGPGYLAVDLFFVLSGFVMAANYGRDFVSGFGRQPYATFLGRRFARVYPLFFVATIMSYGFTKVFHDGAALDPTQALVSNFLAVQNLGVGLLKRGLADSLDRSTWSISTEAGAYLLFPWLAAAVLFRSWRLGLSVCAVAAVGLIAVSLMPLSWLGRGIHGGLDLSEGTSLWPFFRCLAGFMLGLMTWRVSRQPWSITYRRQAWMDALLLIVLLAAWPLPHTEGLIVMLFPVLIWQLCTDQSPLARLLSHPVPHWFGIISYALYLVHFPALELHRIVYPALLSAHVPHAWALTMLLTACAALGVAALANRVIEVPARTALRRLFRHRSPAAVQASGSASGTAASSL